MKLSVVISIYNSHGVVDRQVKYFKKMDLPDDVEFIFVDDMSNPPLKAEMKNLSIYRTDNDIAWGQAIGKNLGVSKATGEYLFMTDIDHIISKEAIDAALSFEGNKMTFRRYFGVLLEDGTLTQDLDVLKDYGFNPVRLKTRGLYASMHGNTYVIKRETFNLLGGYKQNRLGYKMPSKKGEDCYFNGKWNRYARKKGLKPVPGPDIYMFPIARYHIDGETNPKGLFHDLKHGVPKGKKGFKK